MNVEIFVFSYFFMHVEFAIENKSNSWSKNENVEHKEEIMPRLFSIKLKKLQKAP